MNALATQSDQPEGKAIGRPTIFEDWMPRIAAKAVELFGATNERLADMLGIGQTTLDRWLADRPEFGGAVKEARDNPDARVQQSLFNRAIGYELPDGKQVLPDVTAQIFWLKNRRPKEWREKVSVEHDAPPTGPMDAQQVIDGLVSLAQQHPIARTPLRKLLQRALDALPE
jgi:hypothetical protein